MNPLLELNHFGQSIWLDFITRRFIAEGKLEKLIRDDGLKGVTSNPTIFQKAIAGSNDYDAVIMEHLEKGEKSSAIFEALAIQDIQQACDTFRSVYDQSQAMDGYVSLEVNPHLARDTRGTLEEVRRLFRAVNRPNVMIKIPATVEGIPAIEQALGEGININITLIFSLQRYQEVLNAWLAGLERASKAGKPLRTLASVASFFVSRVDSLIDKQLDQKITASQGDTKAILESLRGKAAIANARLAYQLFEQFIQKPDFRTLQAKGAQVQRPLWASTSTKNPAYRDVLYVEELIGPHTVNTLPPQTLDAFRDHGQLRRSLGDHLSEASAALERLAKVGIDMAKVTQQLEEEGVKHFVASYDELIASLDQKREKLKVGAGH